MKYNVGDRFGQLTITEAFKEDGKWIAMTRCDCGNTRRFSLFQVRFAKSCGCRRNPRAEGHNVTHGLSKTKEYKSWHSMKSRCLNPSCVAFDYYGGRGIAVCERWLSYANFLADMGPRPEGATLERIDSNLDYGPENCVWADWNAQSRNRRTNVHVNVDGRKMVLIDAFRHLGIKGHGVRARARRQGISMQEMIDRYVARRDAVRPPETRIDWAGLLACGAAGI